MSLSVRRRLKAILVAQLVILLVVASYVGAADGDANERWNAALNKWGGKRAKQANFEDIKRYVDNFDPDLRGPLRGFHLYNEFSVFSQDEWSAYIETLGLKEPQRMEWPKGETLPKPHTEPHTESTARIQMDIRGHGITMQNHICKNWVHVFKEYAELHRQIIDPKSNLPASQRLVLQIGSGGGGLGNRLGPYLTWFLLCVATKRACFIDEQHAAMTMSQIFTSDRSSGYHIDWVWSKKIEDGLRKTGLAPKQFHMDPDTLKHGKLHELFQDNAWAHVPQALQQDIFGSTALLHSVFGGELGNPGNPHLITALKRLGAPYPANWVTPGCLARWLFQPKPHIVDAMAPYLNVFDRAGYVVGIHVRLGFLVPGAGADAQVEPNSTVTNQIREAMRVGDAGRTPWGTFDDWIERAGKTLWNIKNGPSTPKNALSTLFACAEHLAQEAVVQDPSRKPVFFLATDSPHVEQLASVIYNGARSDTLRPKLIVTKYDAVHSMQANTVTKQMGIAVDWWLLALADDLISPGTIQSTFSGSAWHMSLRSEQLKHIDYRTKCLRGGGPPFNIWGMPDFPSRGKGQFREDDEYLSLVRKAGPEIVIKTHHEL